MKKPAPKSHKRERYPVIVPTFDRAWFESRFERLSLTHDDVARKMKRDRSSVSFVLSGRRRLTLPEAATWAQLLGEDVRDVVQRAGVEAIPEPKDAVSIEGWVDGDLEVHWGSVRGPQTAPRPTHGPSVLSAIRFETGGITAFDGAIGYFSKSLAPAKLNPGDLLLKLCLVEIQGREGNCLRVIRRGYRAGYFALADMAGAVREQDVKLVLALPILSILFGE